VEKRQKLLETEQCHQGFDFFNSANCGRQKTTENRTDFTVITLDDDIDSDEDEDIQAGIYTIILCCIEIMRLRNLHILSEKK
jgi:hypothetical protein